MRILVALLFACLWLHGVAQAAPATHAAPPVDATVLRVIDGDSLWLAPVAGGAPMEVRLQDIDAPEICQPWGPEARDALRDLVLNKPVRAKVSGHDVHGRTLAVLYLDTLNVNRWLVKEGHAWSARVKYDRGPYVADERMAKALGRGLNQAGNAVMPRDFRRDHGACPAPESGPAAAPAAAAPPAPLATQVAVANGQVFRCDGRVYCSQMRSCAEATFFLKHCPGVKMDGNGDGVPCEKQWCGH
jgi:micrococcal nuclease